MCLNKILFTFHLSGLKRSFKNKSTAALLRVIKHKNMNQFKTNYLVVLLLVRKHVKIDYTLFHNNSSLNTLDLWYLSNDNLNCFPNKQYLCIAKTATRSFSRMRNTFWNTAQTDTGNVILLNLPYKTFSVLKISKSYI